MAVNGGACIAAVLEHLKPEDVQLLLANRGLPSVGPKEDLTDCLQTALREEMCEWEWEQCDVPGYHAEIVAAGSTMSTHNNCIYVFGGMDDERSETNNMWRWDLNTDDGFEPVNYRGHVPPKMMSGHFAAVYQDWLWVFPGPKNHNMRRIHCCDLLRYRWEERTVMGDPPSDAHSRRSLDCFVDGRRLIVFGGPQMEKIWFFDFETRMWTHKACTGGHSSWSFGHAHKRGKLLYAYGTPVPSTEEGLLEVWELDLASFRWRHVECKGATPPYRIHSSASAVVDKWLIHGGRKPGKFNVTNQTFVLDFATWRWSVLMAEGAEPVAREWQRALGLQDCMVLVGGRLDIPDFEPIPITNDTMSSAVEILWSRPRPGTHPPAGKAVLLNNIMKMYNSPLHSDVSILVEGSRIAAHRQVLATHSKVFQRMWEHDLQERKTSEVVIVDFDEATVRCLLQYMYGCLPEMPRRHHEVIELFKASDKYDVPGLLSECIHIFHKITEARHVAYLLQVADERDSDELRGVCTEVACTCLPNVVVAPSFKALVQRSPDLCLHFIKEVSLRLAIPCLPEPIDADGCPLSEDPESDAGGCTPSAAAGGTFPQIPTVGPMTPPREDLLTLREEGPSAAEGGPPHPSGVLYAADVESLGSAGPDRARLVRLQNRR